MSWITTVKIKHLLTEAEDHTSVQRDMNAVADALARSSFFRQFDIRPFRQIPEGDEFFGPVDYANKLLDKMYNYANYHRIWID